MSIGRGLRLKPHGRHRAMNGHTRPFMVKFLPWSFRARPATTTRFDDGRCPW